MNKLKKIVGIKKNEFDQYIFDRDTDETNITEKQHISLKPARLIPLIKPGNEMALTSVFLSALRLIEEFRRDVFNEINMTKSGQIFTYTEIIFTDSKECIFH